MMDPRKPLTPGVYIQELNAFPNSIVEVETAVPVFIGYTEKSVYLGENLAHKPVQIASMNDYISFFGGGHTNFKLTISSWPPETADDSADFVLPTVPSHFSLTVNGKLSQYSFDYQPNSNFYLYKSIQLFYQNGGGKCFIVSVGDYSAAPDVEVLMAGLATIDNQTSITLISIPDSLLLTMANYVKLNQAILLSCENSKRTFALFDIFGGDKFTDAKYLDANASNNIIEYFRTSMSGDALMHSAAYFPWLQTSIMDAKDIGFTNFDLSGFTADGVDAKNTDQFFNLLADDLLALGDNLNKKSKTTAEPKKAAIDYVNAAGPSTVHPILLANSQNYTLINKAALNFINIMPTAPAMAGIYTSVDSSRGVWKAPANVSLNAVIKPLYNFTDEEQGAGFNLNVDPIGGKSINIIRTFQGVGNLVWGARTLAGNSQDWRYVNVRRTMTMIEQSVKLAAQPYVFEPNVANTWVTIECMLDTFLNSLWKQGALAGAVAADAYSVNVGLGKTMTGDDILNGIMNIVVLVAISHPAEFLIFSFQQQMQKS